MFEGKTKTNYISNAIFYFRLTKNNLSKFIDRIKTDCPLFYVDASLLIPQIILQPNRLEVYNIFMQIVKMFLERFAENYKMFNQSNIYVVYGIQYYTRFHIYLD